MRLLREIDGLFLSIALIITLLGITMIYSAAIYSESALLRSSWERQALFAVFALLLALAIVFIPKRLVYGLAYPLYAASLLSLLLVLVWGHGEGATRWFDLGPLDIQPAEFAKIAVIIALARYLSDCRSEELNQVRNFLGALAIIAIPMVLVIRQPDLGTTFALGAGLFPMLYWAGMHPVSIFLIVSPLLSVIFSFEPLWQRAAPFLFATFIVLSTGIIHLLLSRLWITITMVSVNLSAGLISVYLWDYFLRPYQKDRIISFLDPERDRLGIGWNIIQSKIAIGSGGFSGKGFLQGTQAKYEFLPAAHTDFIFSVIGEELGFVGSIIVLALFLFLIIRALQIGAQAENRFSSLVAIGLASMFTFHVFVNVGMTIGVMPVTGLPLPFLTYGGSSLIANFTAIGLLLHVYIHRHEY